MPARKILKLRYDSWSRYTAWQGNSYVILPTFTHQLIDGSAASSIASRIATPICPACGSSLRKEEQAPDANPDWTGTREFYDLCDSCGFWRFEVRDNLYMPYYTLPHVKRFDYETTTPSLAYLSSEIYRNRDKIYAMDPTKFEIFVGSVLSDFLNCEVHHVGRTGDDGIDLIALVGDSPQMIQVKRRGNASATEGIDVVKLLFASAFVQNANRGMIVTSAKRFTRAAKIWSESPRIVDSGFKLELVDMNNLMSIVGAVAMKDDEPAWHRHRKKMLEFTEPSNGHAHQLLNFQDFDAVLLREDDRSLVVFEHADLTKIYTIELPNAGNLDLSSTQRFDQFKDKYRGASVHVLHDEAAVQLADRLPFATRQALVERWTRRFPGEIVDLD